MSEVIELGDISITVTQKEIKNVHLSVHPPNGRVTMSAPKETRPEVARSYAISKDKLDLRAAQEKLRKQARESPRVFVERESHYLWGRRYLMTVMEQNSKPCVTLVHKRIILSVRPGSDHSKRASIIHEWHKSLLHEFIPPLIDRWEPKLGVHVVAYYLQRMENQVGKLQPQCKSHQIKYRAGQKAQGPG